MPTYFGVICRSALWAATAVGVSAVLLGHFAARPSPDPSSSPAVRFPALGLHGGLNNYLTTDENCRRWLIDRKTGDLLPCTIPAMNRFDLLGCSPWRDAAGQYHLAMRYEETDGKGAKRRLLEMGLARCTYPERRVVDRVVLDPLPLSKVCWYPDRGDTIIYAAADGQLYRYAFSEGQKTPGSTIRPQPIRWEAATLNTGLISVRDLCWSSNRAPSGYLLATLCFCDESSATFTELHLWWLKLSADGQTVVAAGSMIAPEEGGAEKFWDSFRLPAVGTTRDGRQLLAYLARVRGRTTWDLWVAPIVEGVTAGVPALQFSAGHELAENCAPLEPVFSAHGRWIHAAIWEGTHREIRVKRFAAARDERRKAPSTRHSVGAATSS